MPVESSRVRQWLEVAAPGISISHLAASAGIPKITLHQQFRRGHIPETSLVAVTRALGLDPVEVLSSFPEYSDLHLAAPDKREVLAFIDWPELIRSVGDLYRGRPISEEALGPLIFSDSSRVWVDSIDPGALRKSVGEAENLTSSNLATNLRGTLKTPLAVTFARLAEIPIASAFVVSGVLSPDEVGWPQGSRAKGLVDRPVSELLSVVESRVAAANKHERRLHAFKEGLG